MKETMKEMVGGCCVCSDERGWPDNPLVYCDGNGCTVAVHQACYGIIDVPTGPWYCRKCESPETKGKVRCELCPFKSGALKRTDTGGWAHVVCALYIPEVRFGNVTSMEPIVLRLIPQERYNKTCYICQDLGKTNRASAGACMQCNKSGCKQQFHVTCAQSLGLLCEEAGNYLDNVKYCGYCQHHYSKLKKGGNVKTIPPYKPVVDQSSDSSEREPSPMATGGGTPTHAAKPKGPGRKSSHSSSGGGKNTPNSSKNTSNTNAPGEKKKSSPSRRGSSAGDAGSKNSTPAPSPQHSTDTQPAKASGGSTPSGKVPAPAASPKPPESAAVVAVVTTAPPTPPASTMTTSVVQAPVYQESVIMNAEAMDTKQTKKRKAVANAAAPVDYTPPATATPTPPTEVNPQNSLWDGGHPMTEANVEGLEKIIKKAKTDTPEMTMSGHFSTSSAPPPPPMPAYTAANQPSPRHLPSPMPGTSGMNTMSNIRSPSQPQGKEREPASLLVSVPLPSSSHGLNLTAHSQAGPSQPELSGSSPHIFHQPQKQAAMDNVGHSPHPVPGRSAWGGLNVAYEMQDPSKPGVSGVNNQGSSKDAMPLPPAAIRNKKRAAMATSVVSMGAQQQQMQASGAQNLSNVRRQPQPTPPPVYQETIKDSPPSSPNSERPLKPKMESKIGGSCTAPHMLGNELNPESGAAARLQEQLTAELAAHAAGAPASDPLVPPPLINKATSSSSGRGGTSSAQSLDQLLERQWEQGSQFLMEQAQHFDIASLLSCLHQLRTENVRLEEHVGNLLQRRDHLLAVNARLAIPLTTGVLTDIPVSGPPDAGRCPRENGAPRPPPPRPTETMTSERAHQLLIREVQQKPS
ncbi:protein AF-10 isoform X2 [Aricia agestis]|uniref:protein AF-10 isoform X2 n=1 Tax=Aricia agestis TaxID=91739 RepID=UPI001C209282|nr:protein AF-10 isoform X2 [Aricia agestis]